MSKARFRECMPGHVIVLGNEKGGSGKSTTAMHVIVVAAEGRLQGRLDRHRRPPALADPLHREPCALAPDDRLSNSNCRPISRSRPAAGDSVRRHRGSRIPAFAEAVSRVEHGFDFVVVDTPGHNSYLMRVSHAMADTLITPINDSFIDFDVLAQVDPVTYRMQDQEPLRRSGRRGASPALAGRRSRHRLDRRPQSARGARTRNRQNVAIEPRGARSRDRLSPRRRHFRARRLPRILPARADRARRPEREITWRRADHVASRRARRDQRVGRLARSADGGQGTQKVRVTAVQRAAADWLALPITNC